MLSRANVNEAQEAVKQAQKGADELEAAYINEVTDFKEGDQVILFKNELIEGEVNELMVAQVKIHDIQYEQFESKDSNGLRFKFERTIPGYKYVSEETKETTNVEPRTEVVSIEFDRMQLASEFLNKIETQFEIPTAESVDKELEQTEEQHAEA